MDYSMVKSLPEFFAQLPLGVEIYPSVSDQSLSMQKDV